MPAVVPSIELSSVSCMHDMVNAVHHVSFQIRLGNIVCFIGPSGCGKTTLLRAIAGLEDISGGEIALRGKAVSKKGYTLNPEKRELGLVFQDYALFPHMTLFENICFGANYDSLQDKRQLVVEMLDFIEMKGFSDRYPHELSGGQQQRVALARTLARKTNIMLFDEPFSNQDVDLRDRLRQRLLNFINERNITALFVTHDQKEAFALGDQVAVMNNGIIEQWDTAYNVYHEPTSRFVADFIGEGRFIKGVLVSPNCVQTALGEIQANRAYVSDEGEHVDILIRPDDIVPASKLGILGKVTNKAFRGADILYDILGPNNTAVLAQFPSHFDYEIGESIQFSLEVDHLVVFSSV